MSYQLEHRVVHLYMKGHQLKLLPAKTVFYHYRTMPHKHEGWAGVGRGWVVDV